MTLGTLGYTQTDTHDVTIKIPNVLRVRITDTGTNSEAASPAVMFDYQASGNIDAYITAVTNSTPLAPTTVTTFGDLKVFANRGTWTLSVSASAFTFSNNLSLPTPIPTGTGLALSDIKVTPTGTQDATVTSRNANWTLSTTSADIVKGNKTKGWASVGIQGSDYALTVDGDEDPGQYVTTVTYTIAAP